MTYDKQKVIDIALAEVDYLEKETNSNLDSKTGNAGDGNYTKYARDLAKYPFYNGSKTGVAWCDVFVDWCFVQAFGKENAEKLLHRFDDYTVNSARYYKEKGEVKNEKERANFRFGKKVGFEIFPKDFFPQKKKDL